MPNPIINPAWGVGLTYTITNSDYLAVDVWMVELDEEPAEVQVTVPAGGAVHVLRNPANWSSAGTEILGAGGWTPVPVGLGNWSLSVSAGAAVTVPAVITVSNGDGLGPNGLLRLVFTALGGAATVVGHGGGNPSIDRLLAEPAILNPQVTSGLPVEELDNVTLNATVQSSVQSNPAPATPLSSLPVVLAEWAPDEDNPAAVTGFVSMGPSAQFTAPAAYEDIDLNFTIYAAYDLNSSGTIDAGEPNNEEALTVQINTVTHGMALVLDRSGSMSSPLGAGGDSKWDGTVKAAHAWLDLFRSFRSGDQHKAGIVTFEHDPCSWTPSPAADVTLRNPQNAASAAAMTSLATLGDLATLNLGDEQTCTPIGDGLLKALGSIGAAMPAGSVASVILLTDGYENAGKVTIANTATVPGTTTFSAERSSPSYSYPNDLVGDRLFVVAVGSSVDEDRLNQLAGGTGYYQMTQDVKQILPAFANMLGEVLDSEQAMPAVGVSDPAPPSNPIYFAMPTGEQRVAFLAPWDSATHNLQVAWRLQGAGSFAALNPAGEAVLGYYRRQFHGLMAVDLVALTGEGVPPATEWRVQHLDGGEVAQPLTDADILCMRDLVTKSEISFDKRQYFLGDPIKLMCNIRSGGKRVSGATVGVDVARPGEGLGTFLTTNSNLHKGDQERRDNLAAQGADPDTGKGLMFKTILRRLEMEELPTVEPPAFFLLDDGAHEDGDANDGDYAALFTDTVKEGTYTFRFRVEGVLDDGSHFSRLFVRSTWVGVRPDPIATTILWTALGTIENNQVASLLTFTPQTAGGEFLGPFRTSVINVSTSAGFLDGPLVDNLDGSYSQRLVYTDGQDPIVSIDVYGTPLPPTGPTIGQAVSCWQLWYRAILCTIRWFLGLFGIHW